MSAWVAYPLAVTGGIAVGVLIGRRLPHRVHVWLHRDENG